MSQSASALQHHFGRQPSSGPVPSETTTAAPTSAHHPDEQHTHGEERRLPNGMQDPDREFERRSGQPPPTSEEHPCPESSPSEMGQERDYQALMALFQATMTPEDFAKLQRQIADEIANGARRLGISPREYFQRIGVFPTASSDSPEERGVFF